MDNQTLLEVMGHLRDFESMKWAEIEQGTGSHFVKKGSLIKKANDRLGQIKQDDVDELFSLRVSGKKRIWGIRDESVLRIIWWDPSHEVCPSVKSHT